MTEIKKPIKKPRGVARLIDGKCIACGARCQSSCPVNCIEMTDSGEPVVDAGKCIGCQKCLKVCPASALEMWFTPEELKILAELAGQSGDEAAGEPDEETRQLQKMLAMYRGVWVVVEQFEGVVAKVSWELLGTGAELAGRLGVPLSAVIMAGTSVTWPANHLSTAPTGRFFLMLLSIPITGLSLIRTPFAI